MRKVLLVTVALLAAACLKAAPVSADILGDQLKTALLAQVQPINQYSSDGTSKVAILDDVLQIGHFNGAYLGFAQVGPSTTVDSNDKRINGYLVGGSFNWSPIIKKFVPFPAGWTFINEQFVISTGYHYDTGLHKGSFSYLQFSVILPLGVR